MLRKLKATKFLRTKYSQCSDDISEIEIVGLLMEYFKEHEYITTKEMQTLCGLSNATALRQSKTGWKKGSSRIRGISGILFISRCRGIMEWAKDKWSSCGKFIVTFRFTESMKFMWSWRWKFFFCIIPPIKIFSLYLFTHSIMPEVSGQWMVFLWKSFSVCYLY